MFDFRVTILGEIGGLLTTWGIMVMCDRKASRLTDLIGRPSYWISPSVRIARKRERVSELWTTVSIFKPI